MATGRNELCPCGSGRKYKHCHEGKRSVSKGMVALLVAIAVIATVGVVASVMDRNNDERPAATTAANPNPMNPGAKRPPGPAPAGKVWSEEHGHWHDINATPTPAPQPGAAQPITVGNTAKAPVPQPPGTPPPGKVWSPEHGHWHDAPR